MRFRKSYADDFEGYVNIRRESILGLAHTCYTLEQLEDWVRQIDRQKIRSLLRQGDFIVGMTPSGDMTCAGTWQGEEIANLYVSPAYARQGWGRALLIEVENDYRLKTNHAHISADAANNAREFYEASGYEFVSLEEMDTPGKVLCTYSLMRKYF